ncbi:MAG: selenide, water dikinase SelD [Paracoccaceae bacterium]
MHTLPLTRDLVLVGGGHAHALVLLHWAMNPLAGARLTVIDPNPTAPYTGMLPGHIAGHYTRGDLEMDLVALCRHAGARLILGRVNAIDPQARTVSVPGRPPIAYDVLSVDIGIRSDLPDLPGFADHAVGAKPLGAYAERWVRFLDEVGNGTTSPEVAIIGAGVGGCELALAMDHRLATHPDRKITVIERGKALPHLGKAARGVLMRRLTDAKITVLEGVEPQSIDAGGVVLKDGTRIDASMVVGAAGSRPQNWLAATRLHLTDGFITVDPMLRSITHPDVFASGDCAHMRESPRAKAGVYAVRQAPILHDNLRAALSGAALRPYRPQRDYLKLISLGGRQALADKWGLPLQGAWLWRVKDGIDRKFMRMFHSLPAMPGPALPREHALDLADTLGDKPLCGGCGAKVGPDALRTALATLPAADPVPWLELGAGDDAAVLRAGDSRLVLATDHLRAVTDDPWLMARIATTHALGDIWAMGAQPQAALVSLILPRLSEPLQSRTLAEIMAGIRETLDAAGARIAGGHTTQGSELTIGLSLTGMLTRPPLTKAGARPGDALILTKGIGSGTLLAAEMQKKADGRAIAALWPLLTQSQAAAASLLAPVAHAMTDVTGFGLAGHLDEILQASGMCADLDLTAIPLLPGALEAVRAGVASTIAPSNRAALLGRMAAPRSDAAALLVDPQTAGGLLAAVPGAQAHALLSALRDAGYGAAIIGSIRAADDQPAIRVTG